MAPKLSLKKNRKKTLELIRIVENEEAVYNPQKRSLFSKTYIDDFWMATDLKLDKFPGESLEEWKSLKAYFRNEHRKVNSGFETKWVHYDAMKFLIPYLKRNTFSPDQVPDEIVRHALKELEGVTRSTLKNSDANKTEYCFDEAEENTANTSTMKDEIVESNNDALEAWVDESFDNHLNFQTEDTIIEEIDGSLKETEYKLNDFVEDSETIDSRDIETIDIHEKLHQNLKQQPAAYHANPSSPSTSSELCSCKTNPDAMFLLSLLPDIQSLSKKDKGQFKLKIQMLLQEMLYPDDDS